MANTVRILITAKDEVSGVFDKVRDKATALSKTDIGKGMAMGAGIAAFGMVKNVAMGALDAVVSFGAGSIAAASALNETMSKTSVIFGDNADKIEKWGGSLASTFALSKQQALDTASGFAGLFKTVGIELDQATDMSMKLTELGADLASFFDTDVESALLALKSGLNGESEPLRRFNVFLSETAVSAKLAQMGIQKTAGAFTEAQKATARYALILEQTGDAQGDMALTSDNYATSMKKLDAEMANLQAEIGQDLLPIMRDLSKWAVDEGVPALRSIVDALKALGDAADALDIFDKSVKTESWAKVVDLVGDLGISTHGLGDEFNYVYERGSNWRKDLPKLEGGLGDVEGAADGAAGSIGGVGDEAKAASDKFDDMTKSIEDLVDALITAAFEPEQLALELKIANRDVKDLAADLAKMVDGNGKPVKGKTWKQVNEAKLALSEAEEKAQKLKAKLDGVDGVSQSDITGAIKRLGGRVANAADEAADLWWYVNKLAHVKPTGVLASSLYKNKRIPTNADGGPIPPYGLSLVGENGPELIRMGAVGGMVRPSAGVAPSQATASGGVTISGPFYFQGIGSDVSAQAANRFGQATLDVIANGLREQRARLGAA